MATPTASSLSEPERRTLDRFVEALRSELGPDLRAVWLFGSRARGEPPAAESDVDLAVITRAGRPDGDRVFELLRALADEEGVEPFNFAPLVRDPAWVAACRATDEFILRELDRDRIVLAGSEGGEMGERVPFTTHGPRGTDGVRARSEQYLREARACLGTARAGLDAGYPTRVMSEAYFAMFESARCALSEADCFARTHQGVWHLFHRTFVKTGRFPPELHAQAREAEKQRIGVDYNLELFSQEQARAAVESAERFLEATLEMLGGS